MNNENAQQQEKEISKRVNNVFLIVLSALSLIGGIISYFYIPGKVPVHFDINWQPDHYAAKEWIFLISALPLLVFILNSSLLEKRIRRNRKKQSTIVLDMVVYMFILIQWITIVLSLDSSLKVDMIAPLCAGIIMIIVGNYMPTIQKNHLVGFRTPWTYKDETTWKKTNRYGGYLLVVSGILVVISGLVQNEVMFAVVGMIVLLGVLAGCIYSYVTYIKSTKNKTK